MIQQTKLENGLTIISNNDDNAKTVTIAYTVKCGSYNEDKSNLGIAHFTEHMLFKGTTHRTSQEISESIEGIGGLLNAATSFEETQYYCTIPSDYWETGIDVISDLIWNNLIPQEEFIKEKQVVLEELKMYDDNPSSKIYDLLFLSLHPSYINRQSIGGTIESVSAIIREQMIKFIDNFYVPDNMIITASGKIDHNKLVNFVDKYLLEVDLKKSLILVDEKFIPDKLGTPDLIAKKDVIQSHLCFGMFGPLSNSDEYYTGEVITSLLGGNSSSRLYQIIREQKGLAYTVSFDIEDFNEYCIMNGYVGLDGNNIKDVKQIILEQLEKLKKETVNENELNKVKAYIKGIMMIQFEKTSSRNNFITNSFLRNKSMEIEDTFKKIDNVTSNDITKFAKQYFRKDNIKFVQIIPK